MTTFLFSILQSGKFLPHHCVCYLALAVSGVLAGTVNAIPSSGGHVSGADSFYVEAEIDGKIQKIIHESSIFGTPYSLDPIKPISAPREIEVSEGAKTSAIYLSWDHDPASSLEYDVYRSLDSISSNPIHVGRASDGSFLDVSARSNTVYYYTVQSTQSNLGRFGTPSESQLGFVRPSTNTGQDGLVLDLDVTVDPPVDRAGLAPAIKITHDNGAIGEGENFPVHLELTHYPEIDLAAGDFTLRLDFSVGDEGERIPLFSKGNFSVFLETVGANRRLFLKTTGQFEYDASLVLDPLRTHQLILVCENGNVGVFLDSLPTSIGAFRQEWIAANDSPLKIFRDHTLQTSPDLISIYRTIFDQSSRSQAYTELTDKLFITPSSILENSTPRKVGRLISNRQAMASYKIVNDPSYSFKLIGSDLHTIWPLDHERHAHVPIKIEAQLTDGSTWQQVVNIQVIDQDESQRAKPTSPFEDLAVFKTDPETEDTDGDGWSDVYELGFLGSDPTNPQSSLPQPKMVVTDSEAYVESDITLSGLAWFSVLVSPDLGNSWQPASELLNGDTFDQANPAPYTFNFENRNNPKKFRSANLKPYERDGKLFAKLRFDFFTFFSEGRFLFELDSDHDGLSDIAETVLGTSIFGADTDGDGLSDSEEIAAGLDPLDPKDGFALLAASGLDPFTNKILDYPFPETSENGGPVVIVFPSGKILLMDENLQTR